MFRQIKSAIIWTYIYRFRKLLLKFLVVLILVIFIEYLYQDVIEYLNISKNVSLIPYILFFKWIILLIFFIYILFSVRKIFVKKSDNKAENKKVSEKKMSRKDLALTAEQIIENKIRKRNK